MGAEHVESNHLAVGLRQIMQCGRDALMRVERVALEAHRRLLAPDLFGALMLAHELLGGQGALSLLPVVGDPPRQDRVQPRAKLPDRATVERRRDRALQRLAGHLLDVGFRQLEPRTIDQVVPVAEGQHADGRLHGVVAARLAGGADVDDEVVIAEGLQLMLGELSESGQ